MKKMFSWFLKLFFSKQEKILYSENAVKVEGWIAIRYDHEAISCETSRFYLLGKPHTVTNLEKKGWTWQKAELTIKKIRK